MKFFLASTLTFACLAVAAPSRLARRALVNDGDILNYALTLEHLEDKFYREGLAKFTQADFVAAGYDATFYANLKKVAYDEQTHVKFLTGAIKAAGYKPVAECKYNFPLADVETFLATASVLEGVGVSAYLGAAASIMSDSYLTAAGSILTVEARHSSYLRAAKDMVPFAQAFDNPLSFNEVFTLAAPFIVSCPKTNAKLPLKPFPTLSAVSKSATIATGSTLNLSTGDIKIKSHKVCAAFITVTGPVPIDAKRHKGGYTVIVPKGIAGQSYLVLTNCAKMVNDDTILAGPAIVEISGTA